MEVDLDDDGGVIYQLKGGKKVPLTETDSEVVVVPCT